MFESTRMYLFALTGLAIAIAGFSLSVDLADADAGATDATPSIVPFPVHKKTLENGLKVVAVPMGKSGLAAHWLAVRTGSRDEYEPGRSGFAHFFEHMMFFGTKTYPREAYAALVTEMGADSNAFTDHDETVYFLNVAAEDLDRVMEIESDRFKHLSYAEEPFQTEAGAVYGEYRKSRNSPFFTLYEAVMAKAFEKHTYGHTVIGYEKDIAAMPTMYEYSRTFFDRYYRPENAILVIAGDISAEQVFERAQHNYGDWKRGYVSPKIEPEPEQTAPKRVDVTYEGQTLPIVWVSYKIDAFSASDRTYIAARVLGELAFGETSDIYRRLVLDQQVVQSIGVDSREMRDPGLWTVQASIKDSSQVDAVLAEIEKTVQAFRTQQPSLEQVEAVKSNMRYSFVMSMDSPSRVAGALASGAGVVGSVDAMEEMYRTLAKVTPADVQAAAQKYLVPERRTIGVLRAKE